MTDWNAENYQHHAGYVASLGEPLVALLSPQAGEHILDLGCGDGVLSERIVAAGAQVIGVDAAASMVSAARERGIDARLGDGMALAFDNDFDAVFSNAALHWMRDADAVIDGVRRALRPGGRFVGEFGGHGNVAAIAVALLAVLGRHGIDTASALPWYFPTATEYRQRLETHGFTVHSIELIPRPTPLPTDIGGWLDTFAGDILSRIPESDRVGARDAAIALLRPALCDASGNWSADYVRLRFSATLTNT